LELKLQSAFVSLSREARGQVHAVLIARYFLWVGSGLIALLLMAGWYWPSTPSTPAQQAAAAETPVERTIRIQSERKWPEKMVFDTTIPTIVPPPSPVIAPPAVATAEAAPAAATPAAAPLEARAEMKPPPRPAPRRQAKVRHHNSRPDNYNNGRPDFWGAPPPSTFASASPGWSFRW